MKEVLQDTNIIAAFISFFTALLVLTVERLLTYRKKKKESIDKEIKYNLYFNNYLRICRSNFIAIDHLAFTVEEGNIKDINSNFVGLVNKYNNNSQKAIDRLMDIDPSYISKENMEIITVIIKGIDTVEDIFTTSIGVLKKGEVELFFEVLNDLSYATSDVIKEINQYTKSNKG